MKDDATLLRAYAEQGSEESFAELVRRHVDLVYAAALRRTGGDPHLAADISQQVFTTLARRARALASHPVLSAWLHTATRNAALNLMISEQRRRDRETAAAELAAPETPAPAWERIRPVLDAAVDDLGESDRVAVILRFLERRPFAEIGAALRINEDAARMRVDRAMEKLRLALGRRGITSTAAALSAVVGAQPVISAPVGMAAALAAQSLATGAASGLAGLTFIMNTKIIAVAALAAGLFFGVGTYVGKKYAEAIAPAAPLASATAEADVATRRIHDENVKLVGEITRLNEANAALRSERDGLQATMVAMKKGMPPPLSPTEQKQKAMLNNLRQIAAARDQFRVEHGRSPLSVLEVVGADRMIRQINPVGGEDYSNLSMSGDTFTLTTADGISATYKQEPYTPPPDTPERQKARAAAEKVRELGKKVNPLVGPAIEAFMAANNGTLPRSNEALIPYFADPQQGADFVEYIEAEKAARGK